MIMEKNTILPFPGLRPFKKDEDYLFFGREKAAADLLHRLRISRFLTIIGTSGCGKSSLIKAGFLPSLYSGFMSGAGSSWRTAFFRPGDNPIGKLADVLAEIGILSENDISREFIETILRRSSRGLIDTVKQARLPKHEKLLIVVDQFEELFRFTRLDSRHPDRGLDSADFVNLLLACAGQTGVPIYVVLAMRSDFLGDCTQFKGLPEAINNSNYLVPRMRREEIRAAIEGPIAVGGAEISPPLVSRLLNDVGDNPDQLPILQHALMRTWDYREKNHRDDEPLDLDHYEAIGTMERALSRHAEEAYAELNTENLVICEKMFKLLTQTGEKVHGVRRPSKVSEICAVTGASEEEVIDVINVFRQPGRTFLMPPREEKLKPDTVIDISHESLMRIWTRLKRWVKEESNSADIYYRLAAAADLYEKKEAGLWRDPELSMALKWHGEKKPNAPWAQRYDPAFEQVTRFLELSKKQQKREIKEKEKLKKIKTLSLFLIIISIAAVVSIFFAFRANYSRIKAKESEERALKAKKEAIDNEARALKAEEKARENEKRAVIAEARALKAKGEAEGNAEKYKGQKEIAEKNERKAIKEENKAKENETKKTIQKYIADVNKAESTFGQYHAKAKELAVQSIAEAKDNTLKAMLALTAYRLYNKAYDNLMDDTRNIANEFDLKKLDDFTWKGKELIEIIKLTVEYDKSKKVFNGLRGKSKEKAVSLPAEIFEALRKAYIANENSQDILYPAESRALAVTGSGNIIFNNRKGELVLSSLQFNTSDSKIPGIKKPRTLSKDTIFQAVSFAETNDRLFCATREGSIIYWQKNDWKESKQVMKHTSPIIAMVYSENKKWLIYSVKNTIYRHNLINKTVVEFVTGKDNFIRAITLVEDHENSFLIYPASKKGRNKKVNIYCKRLPGDKKEKERMIGNVEAGEIHAIAYHQDKKLLTLGDQTGQIFTAKIDCKKLKSNTGIEFSKLDREHKGIVRTLTFSRDGKYMASGSLDNTIMLWEVKGKNTPGKKTMAHVLTIDGKLKILSAAFDANGEYVIFSDEQNLHICPTRPGVFNEKLCHKKKKEKWKFTAEDLKRYIDETIKKEDIMICSSTGEK